MPIKLGRYALAVVSVTLATLVLVWLDPVLSEPVVVLLYLLPVLLSTTLGGWWPGMLASLGAFLAYNYLFVEPLQTLSVTYSHDLVALLVFLGVAGLVSNLVAISQASVAKALARERETAALFELTAALSAQSDLDGLWRVLDDKAKELLGAAGCRVDTHPPPTGSLPFDGLVRSLDTARGKVGTMYLGGLQAEALSPDKGQLLEVFCVQAAIAVERVQLAREAYRARMLQESDELKSALLSSVSHDFRTPLATIKASVTSLLQRQVQWDAEARAEFLDAINQETDRLNRLVGHLLDMTRIEAGVLRPEKDLYALDEVLGAVTSRLGEKLAAWELVVDLPPDLPLVPVDFVQMDQVFTNLLENAIKYAPEGSAIAVRAWVDDHHVTIAIHNAGPAIPADQMPHVFDKFHKLRLERRQGRSEPAGTGLGLSICRGIVEAHGGRIWAENPPRGGVNFIFTLPLEDYRQPAAEALA